MKAVFPAIRPARSRPRAKTKASRCGRFKKTELPENPPTHFLTLNALHVPLVTGDRAEGVLTVRLASSADHRATRIARRLRCAARAFREQGARVGRKPRSAGRPPIAEITEGAFRFCLARIENAARRDVGGAAATAARSRGIAASRSPSYPHGRSFARRDAFGVRSASNRCASGAIRVSWCAKRLPLAGLKENAVQISVAEKFAA